MQYVVGPPPCEARHQTPRADPRRSAGQALAAHATISQATLHRRFRTQLGTTPLAWLTAQRVALACRLMEEGEVRLDRVARLSGLGTATNLRSQLKRRTGLPPTAYRRRFGPG
ncbi:helix-turn-helix domain-containing protein [Streptomyces liangshanensis]|uniref:Helix-turn-helix domain-containing protein n=1 Tax=Streptomyces liangshanensis TaxID=2717324 RepID=A0A6G9H8C8_9ACTN|nr:helix-turn-helix domain-containing protein [Streptomyces liangshanensis]